MEDMEVYELLESDEIDKCALIIQLLRRVEALEYRVHVMEPKEQ